MLGLIRRTFSLSSSVKAKKLLYLSLVRSKITYCFQVWRPCFIKDIIALECIQRHAKKFILGDFSLDYKSHLIYLHLLPLMYVFERFDILLLSMCLSLITLLDHLHLLNLLHVISLPEAHITHTSIG